MFRVNIMSGVSDLGLETSTVRLLKLIADNKKLTPDQVLKQMIFEELSMLSAQGRVEIKETRT